MIFAVVRVNVPI